MTHKKNGFIFTGMAMILAVMSMAALIAINPAGQIARGRDTRRKADIASINSAILRSYSVNGEYPFQLTEMQKEVEIGTCDECIDLSSLVPEEMPSVPFDPQRGTEQNTGYFIAQYFENRFTIIARYAETEHVLATP